VYESSRDRVVLPMNWNTGMRWDSTASGRMAAMVDSSIKAPLRVCGLTLSAIVNNSRECICYAM
jgi:hypothetical protein